MKELCTEIEINTSAETVWHVLTDFDAYAEWNPFIRRLQGPALAGVCLNVTVRPPGGKAMSFHPIVLVAERNHELRWLGRLWVPGLFDGEHSFTIDVMVKGRVRFIHREQFTGLLVPLLGKMLDRNIQRGFEEMNSALKMRCESSRA